MIDPNAWDWWVDANERRQWLILTKHQEGGLGLSVEQEAELDILQKLAELIMEAASPSPLSRHLKIAREVRKFMGDESSGRE